ncbi:BglG family transcription antiterminator [Kroppenstedtia sanguinis]
MVYLTERQRSIAAHLLQQTKYITVRRLSERFRVSPRTIRYDLDHLQNWFEEQGLQLERRPRCGLQVIGTPGLKRSLQQKLDLSPARMITLSKNERIRLIAAYLLRHPERTRIDDLVHELGVSRGTIRKDLAHTEEILQEYKIRLIRQPGYGLCLKADEFQWRQAASALLIEHFSDGIHPFHPIPDSPSQVDVHPFYEWLPEAWIQQIEKILREWEDPLLQELSDRAIQRLLVHIGLMISRLQQSRNIRMPKVEMKKLRHRTEYRTAQRISEVIQRKYHIYVPENETGNLALHLLGAKRLQTDHEKIDTDDIVLQFVEQLIEISSETLQIPLQRDRELREGLYIHLKPTLIRLKYGLSIENPMLKEIRTRYPRLYAVAQKAAFWLEKKSGFRVPPGETAYLAMHLGAALQRSQSSYSNSRRILLVCASGVGTSKLLESFLRRELPQIEWLETATAGNVKETVVKHRVDAVVSTLSLSESSTGVPVFNITPVPTREDIQELKERLLLTPRNPPNLNIESLVKLIHRYAEIRDPSGLRQALGEWFLHSDSNPFPPIANISKGRTRYNPMLDQLLKPEHILPQRILRDWKSAVQAGAAPLVKQHLIEESYVEQIERSLIEHGAYMVIAPGIALLHARPEDGVNAVCMSLMTLQEPIPFGHEQNDPVDVVITFAALDNEMHLTALSQLMELLSEESHLNRLRRAESVSEIQHIIQPFISKGGNPL